MKAHTRWVGLYEPRLLVDAVSKKLVADCHKIIKEFHPLPTVVYTVTNVSPLKCILVTIYPKTIAPFVPSVY